MKTPLQTLSLIDVASPCKASWDDMPGDALVRFCGLCSKNVYNLSALTEETAIALIHERAGDLCGKFFRRSDGTVVTADCPGARNIGGKGRWAALAASLAGILSVTGASKPEPFSKDELPAQLKMVELPKPLREYQMTLGRININAIRQPQLPLPEVLPMPRIVNPESESKPG